MNAQVIWIMNEIFKMYCEANQFSIQKLKDLGDKLNDECLFHFSSSFSSWQTLKEAQDVNKKELFKALRENSNRTFTTRIIFMEMIYYRDRPGYDILRKNEIAHILETLRKSRTFCDLGTLQIRGMLGHEESISSSNTMFDTLATGFYESSEKTMAEKILAELKKNVGHMRYKEHDHNKWIASAFKMRTSAPWDPLVFLVCANIYNCVVSIQANNNDEYRIYPENVSDNPTIKFARVESSKYVCLKRDQEIFDRMTVAGCYISYRQKMKDTMTDQVAEMRDIQKKNKKKQDENEDLIDTHKCLFKKMVRDKNDLQGNVGHLQAALVKSEESLDEVSEMFDEFLSRKKEFDEKVTRYRQQKDMAQAQVSSTNSVQVTTQGNGRPEEENEMTLVDI